MNEHLDHAMLQRLKTRDRRTELLALFRVFDRCVIQCVEYTDGFGAQQERSVIGNALERGCAGLGAAETSGVRTGERERRGALAIDRPVLRDLYVCRFTRNRKQRDLAV